MNAPKEIPSTDWDAIPHLVAKLRGLRTRLCWAEGTRRLAIVVVVFFVFTGLALLADWMLVLPVVVRRCILMVQCLALLIGTAWTATGFFSRRQRDIESLALLVERVTPELSGRLISVVQFSLGHAAVPNAESAALVGTLARETETLAATHDFCTAVDWKPWRRAFVWALATSVFVGNALLAGGNVTQALWRRYYLGNPPIPRRTQITSVAYPQQIGIGDAMTVVVQAAGILPDAGGLRLRYASGQRAEVPLVPDDTTLGGYRAALESVPESFTLEAILNDARSPKHQVTAIRRPAVTDLVLTQHYPKFTSMAPTVHAPGDLHLFPGATVKLAIRASKAVASGTLGLLGIDHDMSLTSQPGRTDVLNAELTVPAGLTGFSIGLVDDQGMTSRELAAYRVTLATDTPPDVRLLEPPRSEDSLAPGGKLALAWKATDRFGIRGFAICFEREAGVKGAAQRLVIPIPSGVDPCDVTQQFLWDTSQLQPAPQPGERLTIWIEADDVNPAAAPGISRRLMLSVVTQEEKRRQLLARVTDAIRRLDGVATQQEALSDGMSDVIREK